MSILLNGRGILGGVALLFGPGVAMVVPAFLTIFYLLSTGLRSRVSYGIARFRSCCFSGSNPSCCS